MQCIYTIQLLIYMYWKQNDSFHKRRNFVLSRMRLLVDASFHCIYTYISILYLCWYFSPSNSKNANYFNSLLPSILFHTAKNNIFPIPFYRKCVTYNMLLYTPQKQKLYKAHEICTISRYVNSHFRANKIKK